MRHSLSNTVKLIRRGLVREDFAHRMARSLPKLVIIAPLLVANTYVSVSAADSSLSPFDFNAAELEPIQFTRSDIESLDLQSTDLESRRYDGREAILPSHLTEFSFKLKPKRPDFSREGAFGLDLFQDPELDVQSRLMGPSRLYEAMSELNDGFVYSAGVKIEHEDADINGTAYVSSSLMGLSYGRLGRLWYGGIDVNLEQFSDDYVGENQPDVLSLDVTTGRRLGFTGLGTNSPLWLLSVQGNYDMHDESVHGDFEKGADWFLNPSLFWQKPGFTFSAQMQVPVEFENLNDEGEPDYRLRAVFEKQFK